MTDIDAEIERAKEMLSLPDGWDDDGAVPILARAFEIAEGIARYFFTEAALLGHLTPAYGGGVDIHWLGCGYELLVHCPGRETCPTYYGDDRSGKASADRVKGVICSRRDTEVLCNWLSALAAKAALGASPTGFSGDPS